MESSKDRKNNDPMERPIYVCRRTEVDCIIDPIDGIGGLYLGNLEGAKDHLALLDRKIRAVLTVAADTGLKYDPKVMLHLIIPLEDRAEFDVAKTFDEGIKFIRENLKRGNVYVHCFAGVSRSVTMVLAYLLQELKMELQAAIELVQRKRKVANPNDGFLKQLGEFAKELRSEK